MTRRSARISERPAGCAKDGRRPMGYTLSPLPGQSKFGVVVTGFRPEMLDDPQVRKDLGAPRGLRERWEKTDGLHAVAAARPVEVRRGRDRLQAGDAR